MHEAASQALGMDGLTVTIPFKEGVLDAFPDLPCDAVVRMIQTNEESIHQHDAHAEREATVGTLQAELSE